MSEKRVTTLEEIRQQAMPEIIEIPGFKPGTTINVAVRLVDLTPYLLELDIGNPLYEIAVKKAKTGGSKEDIIKEIQNETQKTGIDLKKILPILDAVVREALVQPTYEEITAIVPLTLEQKFAIFDYAIGEVEELTSFRGQ